MWRKLHTLDKDIFIRGHTIALCTSGSVINRFLLQSRKTMTNFKKFRSLSCSACRNRFSFLERTTFPIYLSETKLVDVLDRKGFSLDARKLLLSLRKTISRRCVFLFLKWKQKKKKKLITKIFLRNEEVKPTDILNLGLSSSNNHFQLEDLEKYTANIEPIKRRRSCAYLRAERIFINSVGFAINECEEKWSERN